MNKENRSNELIWNQSNPNFLEGGFSKDMVWIPNWRNMNHFLQNIHNSQGMTFQPPASQDLGSLSLGTNYFVMIRVVYLSIRNLLSIILWMYPFQFSCGLGLNAVARYFLRDQYNFTFLQLWRLKYLQLIIIDFRSQLIAHFYVRLSPLFLPNSPTSVTW